MWEMEKISLPMRKSGCLRDSKLLILDLIKKGQWHDKALQVYFLPPNHDEIMKIPLLIMALNHRMVWHYEKDDRSSIRSKYRLALALCSSNSPSFSYPNSNCGINFGSLNSSQSTHFLWWCCWDIIPSLVNLKKRHVLIWKEDSCQLCRKGEEDSLHALFFDVIMPCLFGIVQNLKKLI